MVPGHVNDVPTASTASMAATNSNTGAARATASTANMADNPMRNRAPLVMACRQPHGMVMRSRWRGRGRGRARRTRPRRHVPGSPRNRTSATCGRAVGEVDTYGVRCCAGYPVFADAWLGGACLAQRAHDAKRGRVTAERVGVHHANLAIRHRTGGPVGVCVVASGSVSPVCPESVRAPVGPSPRTPRRYDGRVAPRAATHP